MNIGNIINENTIKSCMANGVMLNKGDIYIVPY